MSCCIVAGSTTPSGGPSLSPRAQHQQPPGQATSVVAASALCTHPGLRRASQLPADPGHARAPAPAPALLLFTATGAGLQGAHQRQRPPMHALTAMGADTRAALAAVYSLGDSRQSAPPAMAPAKRSRMPPTTPTAMGAGTVAAGMGAAAGAGATCVTPCARGASLAHGGRCAGAGAATAPALTPSPPQLPLALPGSLTCLFQVGCMLRSVVFPRDSQVTCPALWCVTRMHDHAVSQNSICLQKRARRHDFLRAQHGPSEPMCGPLMSHHSCELRQAEHVASCCPPCRPSQHTKPTSVVSRQPSRIIIMHQLAIQEGLSGKDRMDASCCAFHLRYPDACPVADSHYCAIRPCRAFRIQAGMLSCVSGCFCQGSRQSM